MDQIIAKEDIAHMLAEMTEMTDNGKFLNGECEAAADLPRVEGMIYSWSRILEKDPTMNHLRETMDNACDQQFIDYTEMHDGVFLLLEWIEEWAYEIKMHYGLS